MIESSWLCASSPASFLHFFSGRLPLAGARGCCRGEGGAAKLIPAPNPGRPANSAAVSPRKHGCSKKSSPMGPMRALGRVSESSSPLWGHSGSSSSSATPGSAFSSVQKKSSYWPGSGIGSLSGRECIAAGADGRTGSAGAGAGAAWGAGGAKSEREMAGRATLREGTSGMSDTLGACGIGFTWTAPSMVTYMTPSEGPRCSEPSLPLTLRLRGRESLDPGGRPLRLRISALIAWRSAGGSFACACSSAYSSASS
mmetsp:Transcript_19614/g.48133  ORF Transcript_19614/g.48133 Transcript_19614/m.48133 type:complete len:255 (-) Transcript_19614:833-1597(-)